MKKFIILAVVALICAACSNERDLNQVENNAEMVLVPVTVRMTNFSITKEEMSSGGGVTRAEESASSYSGIGALMLAFYDANGAEALKVRQVKSDKNTYTTYGEFSCNLPIGSYTMVALAYYYNAQDDFTLTSPTEAAFTSEKPREMFCKTQSVMVTSATPLEQDVTLNRIDAKLEIHSTDVCSAGVTKIRTTYAKGGKSFNPSTGLALTDNGFIQTQSVYKNNDGTLSTYSFPYLYTNSETIDVTFEALDNSDNVLFTKTLEDVPFERNCRTTVSGAIFTASSSSIGIKLETGWGTDKEVNF